MNKSNTIQAGFAFLLTLLMGSTFLCSMVEAQTRSVTAHFIDVGYGDSTLIVLTDNSTILIDAGDAEHANDLIKYLKSQKIEKIDSAVITHPHKNHYEGFFKIKDQFEITDVYINGDSGDLPQYEQLISDFYDDEVNVYKTKADFELHLNVGEVEVKVLHPENLSGNKNENSIVLWLEFNKEAMLFFSDVGPAQQDQIIQKYPFVSKAKYVQYPHHGDQVSDLFLKTFQGQTFIVSTGKNEWNLPDESALNQLQGTVVRTDQQGTIVLKIEETTIQSIRRRY